MPRATVPDALVGPISNVWSQPDDLFRSAKDVWRVEQIRRSSRRRAESIVDILGAIDATRNGLLVHRVLRRTRLQPELVSIVFGFYFQPNAPISVHHIANIYVPLPAVVGWQVDTADLQERLAQETWLNDLIKSND